MWALWVGTDVGPEGMPRAWEGKEVMLVKEKEQLCRAG